MWNGKDVWTMEPHEIPRNCGGTYNGRQTLFRKVQNAVIESGLCDKYGITTATLRLICFQHCVSLDWTNFETTYYAVLKYLYSFTYQADEAPGPSTTEG